ncbi:MAG: haloalkane dehalogenase [Porticoccaceae bacterium]|nr:haloalkane dehalogenase [Porticoccaceae bacterium]
MSTDKPINATMKYTKQQANILGKTMSYVDVGSGDPIVFLHGNPTSSYLWRNIIPHCETLGRCIAPDLIGMGDSEKLSPSGPDSYRFAEHREYLDALLDHLGVNKNVTLVIHDWGSALGFDWANRHRDAVKGIAYMEGIIQPLTWEEWPRAITPVFEGFRSPAGDKMVLEDNVFIEQVLTGAIIRTLSDEEMTEYRRPFLNPGEDRRPMLTWPRQIPLAGEPEDVVNIVKDYGKWLATSDVKKLFINADPGAILRGTARDFCRTWKNQTEVTVPGIHFVQEDAPDEIGKAVAEWMS